MIPVLCAISVHSLTQYLQAASRGSLRRHAQPPSDSRGRSARPVRPRNRLGSAAEAAEVRERLPEAKATPRADGRERYGRDGRAAENIRFLHRVYFDVSAGVPDAPPRTRSALMFTRSPSSRSRCTNSSTSTGQVTSRTYSARN